VAATSNKSVQDHLLEGLNIAHERIAEYDWVGRISDRSSSGVATRVIW
jgi:hypothetical protein